MVRLKIRQKVRTNELNALERGGDEKLIVVFSYFLQNSKKKRPTNETSNLTYGDLGREGLPGV
jgi:hypothetical protein